MSPKSTDEKEGKQFIKAAALSKNGGLLMFGSGFYQSIRLIEGYDFAVASVYVLSGHFQKTGSLAQALCNLIQTGGLLFREASTRCFACTCRLKVDKAEPTASTAAGCPAPIEALRREDAGCGQTVHTAVDSQNITVSNA